MRHTDKKIIRGILLEETPEQTKEGELQEFFEKFTPAMFNVDEDDIRHDTLDTADLGDSDVVAGISADSRSHPANTGWLGNFVFRED